MKRPWVKVAAIVAALFVVIVILVPFFVNADTFRPALENQLSSALGRKVTLGHLSFSLLSGSLVADNISIADDPAFSTSPFLQAKSFHIGVHIAPLLFHHQVEITRLIVSDPSINLIHVGNGKWNFSSLGGASATPSPPSQQQTAIPDLTVGRIEDRKRHRHRLDQPSNQEAARLHRHQPHRPAILLFEVVPVPALGQTSRRRLRRAQRHRRSA